ncbi:vesicular glutamate transporter 2.2-like [Chelonus insularis]|uniref:vesicular glutamate transporter 2.2-like n=1 Tax=Chelonus insularis TaxID=460826 RepID=UPI00158D9D8C|nr:vesicular glutamate transporter 2.2-like [Chelonus insularis]XP_034941092.1 vesicular glutamate transporter 2.2-like [Chelonus insularis]XP_034941093.1 vesicular glutamate transporter 2.2-like [Chelonus insularis]
MQNPPTIDPDVRDDPVGWRFWRKRRYVVAILAFFGYVAAYSLRVNLSVAIVAMTSDTSETEAEFHWNSKLQGIVLSSFFYGYASTQLLGGWLSSRIGGKRVFGIGIGVTALLTVISPPLVRMNVYVFIALRIIEGIFEGLTIPCTHAIWSKWAPPLERSKLVSSSFAGTFVGTVVAMPTCAIMANKFGWSSNFYVYGTFGLVWFVLWWIYVTDDPADDPRISESELKYLQHTLGKSEKKTISHPWKAMFTSSAAWAIVAAHFSELWGFFTMLTQLPKFMKDVLNFNLDKSGYLSAIPYLILAFVLPVSGFLGDYVISKNFLSTTNVRKVTTCASFLIQTVFITMTAFTESATVAVVGLCLAIGLGGFAMSGFGINHLDIAPPHASVLLGISNTIATFGGIISPLLSGYIVQKGTAAEWRIVFLIAGAIYLIGALIYGIFASGELQKWSKNSDIEKNEDSHAYSNRALDVDTHM